jgi:ribosomal protein S25
MKSTGPLNGLSPRAERFISRLSTITVIFLAAAAAVLSFSGLRELSLNAGFSPQIAWILPIVLDGMVVTGSLGVVSSSLVGVGTWYPWLLTMIGVVASIAGNIAVAPPNLASRLVHAAGPATFALSIEGLLRIYRASAMASAQRERARLEKEQIEAERIARAEHRNASKTITTKDSAVSISDTNSSAKPLMSQSKPSAGKTRESVHAIWAVSPDITGAEVAKQLEIDPSYARRILRELREEAELKNPVKVGEPKTEAPSTQVNEFLFPD